MNVIQMKSLPQVGSEIGSKDSIVQVISVDPSVPSMVVSDYFLPYPNATTYLIEIK